MSRAVLIAILGLAAAAAAVVLAALLDSDGEADKAGPSETTTAPAPVVPAVAQPLPAFDIIRIGEDGNAVLAGRADAKSEVTVLDGGHELGRTHADERGEWVLVPTQAMAPGARALTIQARDSETAPVRSSDPVILVVPRGPDHPALAMAPQAEGGPRLILGPGGEPASLSIDLVDLNQDDRMFMGGRAPAGATLYLYLDTVFVGSVPADAQGGWRLAAKTAGGHLLRVDQVDAKGKVLARIEAPLQAPPALTLEGVVVEPGASLWTIARRLNGSGQGYTVIYQANTDRIRDPNRIYPGQVFLAPRN